MVLKVNKKQFSEAIDRVSVISFDKLKAVKLSLKHDLLNLSATGDAAESSNEEISAQYQDQEIEVGFNARYLLEIIVAIQGEEVECFFDSDVDAAVLIRDASDASTIHVIMPMLV